MNTYKCTCNGRGAGSLGKTFAIEHVVRADSAGHARAAVYQLFEQISELVIVEITE